MTAETPQPVPINRHGAIEMTASMRFGKGPMTLEDAGFDAAGKEVWRSSKSFVRKPTSLAVIRGTDGLVGVTVVSPATDAPKLRPVADGGGEITIHFTYWTSTGQKIDTSRKPDREPVKVRIPGGTPFPAMDTALAGIAKGERRKIVVPALLAYGASGRGTVPPNATLIYDVECLGVDNSAKPTPPPSPHSAPPVPGGVNPHTPNVPQAPPRGDEPIG